MQEDSELPASYDAVERAFAYTNEFQSAICGASPHDSARAENESVPLRPRKITLDHTETAQMHRGQRNRFFDFFA
jgi:hypothetical protein